MHLTMNAPRLSGTHHHTSMLFIKCYDNLRLHCSEFCAIACDGDLMGPTAQTGQPNLPSLPRRRQAKGLLQSNAKS